jgi:hypothetical protein
MFKQERQIKTQETKGGRVMPVIHDKQSAKELAQTVLWWGDKLKALWRGIKRWGRAVRNILRFRKTK